MLRTLFFLAITLFPSIAFAAFCEKRGDSLETAIYRLQRKVANTSEQVGVATVIDPRGFFLTAKHIFDNLPPKSELWAENDVGHRVQLEENAIIVGSYSQANPAGFDWAITTSKSNHLPLAYGDLTFNLRAPAKVSQVEASPKRVLYPIREELRARQFPAICSSANDWYLWLDGYLKGFSGSPVASKTCIDGITSRFAYGQTESAQKLAAALSEVQAKNQAVKENKNFDGHYVKAREELSDEAQKILRALEESKIVRIVPAACIAQELAEKWSVAEPKIKSMLQRDGSHATLLVGLIYDIRSNADQIGKILYNAASHSSSLSTIDIISLWERYSEGDCGKKHNVAKIVDLCERLYGWLSDASRSRNLSELALGAPPPKSWQRRSVNSYELLEKLLKVLGNQRGARFELVKIDWFEKVGSKPIEGNVVDRVFDDRDELFDETYELRLSSGEDTDRQLVKFSADLIRSLSGFKLPHDGGGSMPRMYSARLIALGFALQALRVYGDFRSESHYFKSDRHLRQIERLLAFTATKLDPDNFHAFILAARTFADDASSETPWYLFSIALARLCANEEEAKHPCDDSDPSVGELARYLRSAIEKAHTSVRKSNHDLRTLLDDSRVYWAPKSKADIELIGKIDGAESRSYVKACAKCSYVPAKVERKVQVKRLDSSQLSFSYVWSQLLSGTKPWIGQGNMAVGRMIESLSTPAIIRPPDKQSEH
jgi:hypothetical protein